MEPSNLILFYDGDCGFCNRSVEYVFRREKGHNLYFTSLNSDFTKSIFKLNGWENPDMNTVYFYENGVLYSKSRAALKVTSHLRRRFSWIKIGYVIPRLIRDKVYDVVAKRRHRIAASYCFVPPQELRSRFLD